jgi:hypothetical protein
MAEATAEAEAGPEDRPKESRRWSEARRKRFLERAANRKTGGRAPGGEAPERELIAEEVVGDAVANMITVAGYAMPFVPYVAVTVAGVPHPDEAENKEPTRWVVQSRARMAGDILLEHAKRDVRILRAVDRFNRLFTNVEAVEIVAAVGAASMVDAKLIDPHATIKLPGGLEMPILAPVIGDTIDYMDQALGQLEEVPQQGPRLERTSEQASPDGEAGATTARQGQTVIEGDVTKT